MELKTRSWGSAAESGVVCVHGVTQRGGIFAGLGERLAAAGHYVLAVDLRGHGESGREPPWNTGSHVADLRETVAAAGLRKVVWVGHSFGGRLVAAAAHEAGELSERVVLLDPGLEVPPQRALRSAEIDRLDWSFATPDGALNALLSSEAMVAPPRDVVAAYVQDDVVKGPDGRYRFSFSPSAAVVAWSEVTLPAPPIAQLPTLLIHVDRGLVDYAAIGERYREQLGDLLTLAPVPNGHNMLWESPEETIGAIERFLA